MKTQINTNAKVHSAKKLVAFFRLVPSAYGLAPVSRGFTILYAVLIASILLAIGIAIFDITVRELRLSSIARESQVAVYAADAGAECALYWGLPTNDRVTFSTSTPIVIDCNGQTLATDVDGLSIGGRGYGATSTFQIMYGEGCAEVSIATHLLDPNTLQVRTIAEARGYNVCDINDPRRVEREFLVIF